MIAVIVGNGPSLEQVDLLSLKKPGTLVYVCNRIHKHPDWGRGFRPDVYTMTDTSMNDEWMDDLEYHMKEAVAGGYRAITDSQLMGMLHWEYPQRGVTFTDHPDNWIVLPECIHRHARKRPPDGFHPPYICTALSPTWVAAQHAVLREGVDRLVFVGCDLGYRPLSKNQFADGYLPKEGYDDELISNLRNETLQLAHELIERESEEYGYEVVNATAGGELEIHQRMALDEVLVCH